MEKNLLNRINELAKKAKTSGLTDEEIIERDMLRKQYLQNFRRNFVDIMERVYIKDEDGNEVKVKRVAAERED